jgi:hypothetical protein
MSILTFIDVEASALRDGYPIEVGWARTDGLFGQHLIKPCPEWVESFVWCGKAEAIHGLSLDALNRLGAPAEEVAEALNRELVGQVVVSDNRDFDAGWVAQLFDAADGMRQAFYFERRPVPEVIVNVPGWMDLALADMEELNRLRRRHHKHSAVADAANWVAVCQGIQLLRNGGSMAGVERIFEQWEVRSRRPLDAKGSRKLDHKTEAVDVG